MFVLDNYKKTVFKTENQYGVFYKVGLSKKDRNGNYINGYLNVRFKKGVNLENKTKICIKNGFIDFYLDKDNKTVPYLMVLEFETENKQSEKEFDPNECFGNATESNNFDENSLPF